MSVCVSQAGEYSNHEPGQFCPRCGAWNPDFDEWCREESCTWRHWTSGSMPTHRRGADCPNGGDA